MLFLAIQQPTQPRNGQPYLSSFQFLKPHFQSKWIIRFTVDDSTRLEKNNFNDYCNGNYKLELYPHLALIQSTDFIISNTPKTNLIYSSIIQPTRKYWTTINTGTMSK